MNMEDHIIRQHQVEIPIKKLSASLEVCEEKGECRYCHEEEVVSQLEAPCNCNGSLKYAHRKCVSHWCNIKRNIRCEICKQDFRPNYSVTEPPHDDDDNIDMSEQQVIPGTHNRLVYPLQLAERGTNRILQSMNTDFSLRNPTVGVILGTLVLVFFVVSIIRDAYYHTPTNEEKAFEIMYFALGIVIASFYILLMIGALCSRGRRERRPE